MPELPEVETVKRTLIKHLKNRTIKSCEVLYEKMLLSPVNEFITFFNNVKILDITRKGKYLIFTFNKEKVLISHLRMEGKYFYYKEGDPYPLHSRIVFHLDNDELLIYNDSRSFGKMELFDKDKLDINPSLGKLGKEPFYLSSEELYQKLKNKKLEIKATILDQSIMAGLGNIYADEVLFACKINPYRKACTISKKECENIIKNSIIILNESIKQGGSTISSYHPENGVDGKFQVLLKVYGKTSTPCPNCKTLIRKDFCHGRGTHYCPNCQKVSKRIGIYGKIAAGKSTVCKYFSSKGYKLFSSDEYVASLYSNKNVITKINAIFNNSVINKNGLLDKQLIKKYISSSPEYKKKLENLLHPLVKKGIQDFILKNKEEELVFIEVPLMFESKCHLLMDYIIGVDASRETQINHLKLRGSKNPELDLDLNKTNKFDKYASKCDFVISNNSSLEELYLTCDSIISQLKIK